MKNHSRHLVGRHLTLCAVAVAAVLGTTVHGGGRTPKTEKVRGHDAATAEVLVKFRTTPSSDTLAQFDRDMDADRHRTLGSRAVHHVHSRSFNTDALLAFLNAQPEVEFAEANYVVHATNTVPNDPYFPYLWGLTNPSFPGADIGVVKAWDISTGAASVVVAVVDTGVGYLHPDLAANIWSAPSAFTVTMSGVRITCAAGTHGFNVLANTCNPMDDNDHGTHVSGTIGARGNNGLGVTGINWTTRIMGVKFLDASATGTMADAVEAIEFAVQAKQIFGAAANVRVLTNSWGGDGYSQALADEIARANTSEMLFVAAAGNNASNNETRAFYPASYTAPNVIAVAATDQTDGLASFSNYGSTTVDLGAPGVGILSTTRGGTYKWFDGTSMATPHVAGTAALVLSACNLTTAELKANLLSHVTPIASLAGITVTGGRLNADAAIRACSTGPGPSTLLAPAGLLATAGDGRVTLSWKAANGASSYTVKRALVSGTEIAVQTGITSTSYLNAPLTNGTKYFYVVMAVNGGGSSSVSNEVSAIPTGVPVRPANLTAVASGSRKITLNWNASAGATSYRVKRATISGGPYITIGSVGTTTGTNTLLEPGVVYFYVVRAVNSQGESGSSNEAKATATR